MSHRFTCLLTLVAVTAVGSVRTHHAAAGPVPLAHYTMEEGVGASTADAQGGTAANLVGQATWSGSYLAPVPSGTTYGVALDRIPTKGYLTVPGFKGVLGTSSRTVAAWINTAAQEASILNWGTNTGGNKWTFRLQNGNGPRDGAVRVEVNGGYIVGTAELDDGRWHHVAAVLTDDGSPNVNEIQIYVDGQLDPVSASLDEPINTTSGTDVRIGQDYNGNRSFPGVLDDVRIYNAALTAADVQELAGTQGGLIAPVLTYNAANDDGANNVWEEDRGDFRPTRFQWDLTGASHVANPPTVLLNIDAAYAFNGTGRGTFGSDDFQDDFQGNLTDQSTTFEIWFRPSDLTGQEVLLDLGGNGDGTSLTLNDKVLQLVAKNGGASSSLTANMLTYGDDEFIQAVGVIDLDADLLQLYLNGELVAQTPYSGNDWAGTDSYNLAGLGGTLGGADGALGALNGYGSFEGEIAKVAFYADAMTPEEVAATYAPAVPEPATMALLGLAACGMGSYLHKRRMA